MPQSNRIHSWRKARRPAVADTVGASPAASDAPRPVPGRRFVGTGSPDFWDVLRAGIFVLVLAPGWLFASISAFRGGQSYVGAVLLFASAFAALSGLMMASPSSFDRRWLWVWGAVGAGLVLLLGVAGVQFVLAG